MEHELVTALWVGPPNAELPDRTVLIQGESTREIPLSEAEASENWQLLGMPVPFDGYDDAAAKDIVDGLAAASAEDVAAVLKYERSGKRRKTILDAGAARLAELEAGS